MHEPTRSLLPKIGYGPQTSMQKVLTSSPDDLQAAVDNISRLVLPSAAGARKTATYRSGVELQLPTEFMEMDDHQLGDAVISALSPRVNTIIKGAKGIAAHQLLMTHIAENVVREFPMFVPKEIEVTFVAILNAETHS